MSKQSDRERERLLEFIEYKLRSCISEADWCALYPQVAERQTKAKARRAEDRRSAADWHHPQRAEEKQELAGKLIDIGYKELAREVHPDSGGSHDEMARLNRVRERLKGAFGLAPIYDLKGRRI